MRKTTKIGIAVSSVLLVGLIISTTLNIFIKGLVCQQLDTNIATADSMIIQYGEVRLTVLTGKAWIKDVYFRSKTASWEEAHGAIVEGKIEMLSLDGINYYNWLVKRQLNLKGFTIVKPDFRVRFHRNQEQKEGDQLQEQLELERQKRLENVMRVARIFIDDATLNRLTIDHGLVYAESINDSLRVSIPEITLSLYDLGYNIKDSFPHYNDSIFHFLIRDVDVHIPTVQMTVGVKELLAKPNGLMQIGEVQIKSYLNPQKTECVLSGAKQVSVGGFDVAKFNTTKEIDIKNIHLYEPYSNLLIDESAQAVKARKNKTTAELTALNQKMTDANLAVVTDFITGLVIDTIFLHDARMDVKSTASHFQLQANQIFMALYGIGYSLIDDIPYHYNDSVYQFFVGHADIVTPDSCLAIKVQDLRYDNGGSFSLGQTHIHHIIDKWKLAHLLGDVPATLVDIHIKSMHTSSKNIIKEIYTIEKGFFLDTLYADIDNMSIFRDARYTVKQPYRLPQTYITQLSYPFVVHCVKANIKNIDIQMALTKQNIGKFNLGPIQLNIRDVTPIRNSTITASATGRMGKASINALFNLKVNKACDWHVTLHAKDIDAHHLDNLLYPIAGMKIGCDIHRLHADYNGDASVATGTFCMEYDHVDIFADKNSNTPIKAIKDLSGLINSAGKTIVNKSNPAKPGQEPVSYQVKWKNNPWVDPAMFYIGPVVDGCIETMLPGLFLHRRIKTK